MVFCAYYITVLCSKFNANQTQCLPTVVLQKTRFTVMFNKLNIPELQLDTLFLFLFRLFMSSTTMPLIISDNSYLILPVCVAILAVESTHILKLQHYDYIWIAHLGRNIQTNCWILFLVALCLFLYDPAIYVYKCITFTLKLACTSIPQLFAQHKLNIWHIGISLLHSHGCR